VRQLAQPPGGAWCEPARRSGRSLLGRPADPASSLGETSSPHRLNPRAAARRSGPARRGPSSAGPAQQARRWRAGTGSNVPRPPHRTILREPPPRGRFTDDTARPASWQRRRILRAFRPAREPAPGCPAGSTVHLFERRVRELGQLIAARDPRSGGRGPPRDTREFAAAVEARRSAAPEAGATRTSASTIAKTPAPARPPYDSARRTASPLWVAGPAAPRSTAIGRPGRPTRSLRSSSAVGGDLVLRVADIEVAGSRAVRFERRDPESTGSSWDGLRPPRRLAAKRGREPPPTGPAEQDIGRSAHP